MNVALITIGNELLSGFTIDTNAAWVGQELAKIGAQVTVRLTVGDDKEQILSALEQLSRAVSVLIVTGGLGPTHDDVTPVAFYTYFDSKPVFDEQYWNLLKNRFSRLKYTIPEVNRNQALKPDNGEVISNPVGSARGLHFEKNGCHFFALPGVPQEMKSMMKESVLPWIWKRVKGELFIRTIRTTGIPESALAEKLSDNLRQSSRCKIAFLPQITGVDIRISSKAHSAVVNLEERIVSQIEKYIYGYDESTLEEAIGLLLVQKSLTIATAESCTGGLLAHRITNVSGSSRYMMGGVVTYSNEAKISQLGVKKETLEQVGAVSEETAHAMAIGVRRLFNSSIGISITGIAGPTGGTREKPVGFVYIGLAFQDQVNVKHFQFFHDREMNKHLSSQVALNMIRKSLTNEK